ncbi:act minimal PKS acyl carrier protein [Nonomuraea polychroma]|uniref:Act minimal PKS acyl carrier protein n=1 Tax=Nonomuraea polychroma TaxID=46176 RepID=A0A438MEC8_9ACTN|nr:acyl carrier protein [Nonomuraea polychroma]RVX44143.1 act minimal PKS acyl carrier protein [Nonomuraea polychroma]
MQEFTLEDLKQTLRAIAGQDEQVDLDGDIHDTPLADLGYDSLALLELASHLEKRYSVAIPDDAVHEMETPRAAIAYINARLAESAEAA